MLFITHIAYFSLRYRHNLLTQAGGADAKRVPSTLDAVMPMDAVMGGSDEGDDTKRPPVTPNLAGKCNGCSVSEASDDSSSYHGSYHSSEPLQNVHKVNGEVRRLLDSPAHNVENGSHNVEKGATPAQSNGSSRCKSPDGWAHWKEWEDAWEKASNIPELPSSVRASSRHQRKATLDPPTWGVLLDTVNAAKIDISTPDVATRFHTYIKHLAAVHPPRPQQLLWASLVHVYQLSKHADVACRVAPAKEADQNTSQAYRQHVGANVGRCLVVNGSELRRNNVVMSMLTLQVPTRVCEAIFGSIGVGVKAAEHYLTRDNGNARSKTNCAVVLWGAEVHPQSLKIQPCNNDQLLVQLALWQRIYDWQRVVPQRDELDVDTLALSEDDRTILNASHKQFYLMNCAPDRAAKTAMKNQASKRLRAVTKLLEKTQQLMSMYTKRAQSNPVHSMAGVEAITKKNLHTQCAEYVQDKERLNHLLILLDKHRHATVRLQMEPLQPILHHAVGDWPARLLVGISDANWLQAGEELAHDYCAGAADDSWHVELDSQQHEQLSQCGCDTCSTHFSRTGEQLMGWSQ